MNKNPVIAAVIGDPVSQSLSPLMHSYWLSSSLIPGRYIARQIRSDTLEEFTKNARQSGLVGFNVTIPYKTAILPFMDQLAPSARSLGAVNTVLVSDEKGLTGFNTDGIGFLNHLKASVPFWTTTSPALVIGAGGASRAIVYALLSTPLPLIIVSNRDRRKAEDLAADIGRDRVVVLDWEKKQDAVGTAGLIVNTTSLGMDKMPRLDLDLSPAPRDATIYDIVYNPLETDLLWQAKRQGLKAVDGLGMLIHQGAAAAKIWFGDKIKAESSPDLRKRMIRELTHRLENPVSGTQD